MLVWTISISLVVLNITCDTLGSTFLARGKATKGCRTRLKIQFSMSKYYLLTEWKVTSVEKNSRIYTLYTHMLQNVLLLYFVDQSCTYETASWRDMMARYLKMRLLWCLEFVPVFFPLCGEDKYNRRVSKQTHFQISIHLISSGLWFFQVWACMQSTRLVFSASNLRGLTETVVRQSVRWTVAIHLQRLRIFLVRTSCRT